MTESASIHGPVRHDGCIFYVCHVAGHALFLLGLSFVIGPIGEGRGRIKKRMDEKTRDDHPQNHHGLDETDFPALFLFLFSHQIGF